MKLLKKNITVLILIGLVFQVLPSCNKIAHEKPIESDIFVEILKVNDSYHLVAKTEKDYSCHNYPIEYNFSKIGRRIKVKFKFIKEVDGCLFASGPARCKIDLGEISTARDYELLFKLNKKENTGKLTFEDSAKIIMNSTTNVFAKP